MRADANAGGCTERHIVRAARVDTMPVYAERRLPAVPHITVLPQLSRAMFTAKKTSVVEEGRDNRGRPGAGPIGGLAGGLCRSP